MQDAVTLAGLDITPFRKMSDAVAAVIDRSGAVTAGFAIAVNAEKLLAAREDPEVAATLKSGTFRYADGGGAVLAMRLKGVRGCRIPGVELWAHLMAESARHRVPVFLLGGKADVLRDVAARLQSEHPGFILAGTRDGYFGPADEDSIIRDVYESGARIVTVAMGSPRQEHFIRKCRDLHSNAFYMGVGGTYDVYAGRISRAPAWVGSLNLEWLYRFAREPRRLPRTLRVMKFGLLALSGRI